MKTKLPILKTDPDFQSLIPPLSQEAYEELELNIVCNGCREPIKVWGDYIIDGHNRYKICHEYDIAFTTEEVELKSKDDVISWICINLIENRDLPENYRRYLIGKQYYCEKVVGAMNEAGANQYSIPVNRKHHSGKTATKIGKDYHVSPSTVNKYLQYVKALDRLKPDFPDLVEGILFENIKISQDNLIYLSKKPKSFISMVVDNISDSKRISVADIIYPTKSQEAAPLPQVTKSTVKDMPVYDPDAYVSSLTLTIPSWISSIKRTAANSDIKTLSVKARYDLVKVLNDLISISTTIKNILEEN